MSLRSIALSVLLLVPATWACGPTTRTDGGKGPLAAGMTAPDLVGEDADGKAIRLTEVRGKFAAVYFYPKDDTPGCTKQACAFRDAFDRLREAGVVVFGVSRDSIASHRAFREKYELPFPLVADESGEVARAYGVPNRLGMSARITFLVGPDGKVAKVFPDVDPAIDAENVLATVRALRAKN